MIVKLKRAKIFRRYLAIRYDKPLTIFLACLFPFMQAFLGTILAILSNDGNTNLQALFLLFVVGASYYTSFIMNAKRSAKGSKLGLILLILFGALGLVCGKLIM